MSKPKKRRTRRQFSPEFKAEAVRLVEAEGMTFARVAKDLDLCESSLRQWVQQARTDAGRGALGALTTDERAELARLRREVRVLQQEREILKKATAFFAKESR
jgi:transposase